MDLDDSAYEKYSVLLFFFGADALPAGVTGRAGKIVLGSYGVTATIQVKQGNSDWVGLAPVQTTAEVTKVARQGDNFVLTYPASATSVSVYNITGQRVADYKLNTNGTTTVPAANWTKGVYILKFNGSNVSVKVIK
jgi:hypothetical protein